MKRRIQFKGILLLCLLVAGGYFSFRYLFQPETYTHLEGGVFGTYYAIVYRAEENLQSGIDSLFEHYSASVSHYDPASEISEFNQHGTVRFLSLIHI